MNDYSLITNGFGALMQFKYEMETNLVLTDKNKIEDIDAFLQDNKEKIKTLIDRCIFISINTMDMYASEKAKNTAYQLQTGLRDLRANWLSECKKLKKLASALKRPIALENSKKRRRESYKLQKEEAAKKIRYDSTVLHDGNAINYEADVLENVDTHLLLDNAVFLEIISFADMETRYQLRGVCKSIMELVHMSDHYWNLQHIPEFNINRSGIVSSWLRRKLMYTIYAPSMSSEDRDECKHVFQKIRQRERHNETLIHEAYIAKNIVKNNFDLFKLLTGHVDFAKIKNVSVSVDVTTAREVLESAMSINTWIEKITRLHVIMPHRRYSRTTSLQLLLKLIGDSKNLVHLSGVVFPWMIPYQVMSKTVTELSMDGYTNINRLQHYYPNVNKINYYLPLATSHVEPTKFVDLQSAKGEFSHNIYPITDWASSLINDHHIIDVGPICSIQDSIIFAKKNNIDNLDLEIRVVNADIHSMQHHRDAHVMAIFK